MGQQGAQVIVIDGFLAEMKRGIQELNVTLASSYIHQWRLGEIGYDKRTCCWSGGKIDAWHA